MTRLRFAACLALLAAVAGAAPLRAGPVDDARLKAADGDAADWLLPGRDYGGRRFSPISSIDRTSVKRLAPKWIYQTGYAATFQTSPVVADGVMYLTAPFSHVMAVDAATGRELWRYEHKSKAKKLCCGPANRGASLGYGKVFVATVDAPRRARPGDRQGGVGPPAHRRRRRGGARRGPRDARER
ncbi:PQQ-binding-like beta-propeller repeat protein [Chenggangzhangella methanolivorans]|uniref:PQQ-binding-like beta-propeller repeat protein n=1 Tax=Chenggangzhangella methanolivorans TaxID=1437009 RepID=UPI0021BD9455|nr:PQQ-binding-like beta-propeller repeat protein [Chenggangzhangella methanolivorans]